MGIHTRVGVILVILAVACGSDDDDDETSGCPDGQVKRNVCVACGLSGGCAEQAEQCATACPDGTDCPGSLFCIQGVCQVGGCI
jgi:hypothetical protein